MSRAFIDTNVLVYQYDARDERKRAGADRVLRGLGSAGIVISGQVLGEFFTTVTRKLPKPLALADAAGAVERLSQSTVIPITAPLVADAITVSERWQVHYWDALILAAARAGGCDRVLTEDMNAGAEIAGIRIENPFT